MANYYWVGSTAASVDSLSWNTVTNWRTISNAAAGKTAATWTTPTRLPMGQDYVYFGSITSAVGSYTPIAIPTYSPMIFGGCSAGVTAGTWPGTTAGTSIAAKRGTATAYINPTYPFSQLGGELNTTILNEWAAQLVRLAIPGSTFGVTGGTADGEPTASYYSPYFSPVGAATDFTVTKPAAFLGEGYIRWMGQVTDDSQPPTRVYFRGITSGLTSGMAGATYAYDGSGNIYRWNTGSLPRSGANQNISTYNGAIVAVPTPIGSFHSHGDTILTGHWSGFGLGNSPKGGSILLTSCTLNSFSTWSPWAYVYQTGLTLPTMQRNGLSGSVATSYTEIDTIRLDQSSNAYKFEVSGAAFSGIAKSINNLIVEGDITSSSGFPCYSGGNTVGVGATASSVPGSLLLYPTVLGAGNSENNHAVCTVGYPSSEANFRTTNLSNINYIYNLSGGGVDWDIGIRGNLTTTEAVLSGGSIYPHPEIASGNNIQIGQLSLDGDSTLDLSQAPNHKGMDTNVIFKSVSARLLPNVGSTIALSSPAIEEDLGGFNI